MNLDDLVTALGGGGKRWQFNVPESTQSLIAQLRALDPDIEITLNFDHRSGRHDFGPLDSVDIKFSPSSNESTRQQMYELIDTTLRASRERASKP